MRRAARAAFTLLLAAPLAALDAQRVTLEVRSRAGDTLHVSFEHSVTMAAGPVGKPDSTRSMTTTYRASTRDVIERVDASGASLLAIIDSLRTRSSAPVSAPEPQARGVRVRLQIRPDGSSRITEGLQQLDPALRDMLGDMPPVLPSAPVAVGESWTRDLPLPADGSPNGTAGAGSLRATFRLDSLTDGGDRAWISAKGRVVPATPNDPAGAHLAGTLTGTMQIDRRRGWLSDWKATMTLDVTDGASGAAAPFLIRITVTQQMHTAPAER